MIDARAWDHPQVFAKQLELNRQELEGSVLPHWQAWIDLVRQVPRGEGRLRLLDIGCGCGARFELCRRHLPEVAYFGCDFSPAAVALAINHWNQPSGFFVADLWELSPDTVHQYDVLSLAAVLDIMQDGDAALEHVLSWNHPWVILSRMSCHSGPNRAWEEAAYNLIRTNRFLHSYEEVVCRFQQHGYRWTEICDSTGTHNFLLERA